ncbi:MAG: hypothetical protein GY853_02040 [PVC group bacterium]|nr:hypothetical protein [PVC group bacterium]
MFGKEEIPKEAKKEKPIITPKAKKPSPFKVVGVEYVGEEFKVNGVLKTKIFAVTTYANETKKRRFKEIVDGSAKKILDGLNK